MSAPALPRRALLAAAGGTLALASAVAAQPASAAIDHPYPRPAGAVFVQLNEPAGNAIAAYDRAGNGTLTRAGTYPTGGLGGSTVDAPLDALASQSSLVLTRDARTLVAVNAGSDTVTSFAVRGSRLERASVVASGGAFPVSVAVRGDLVYVLDAAGAGSVSGYRLAGSHLVPLPGSTRSLGLANTNPPLFISASSSTTPLAPSALTPPDSLPAIAPRSGRELAGRHPACWCKTDQGQPCHVDVRPEVVNAFVAVAITTRPPLAAVGVL